MLVIGEDPIRRLCVAALRYDAWELLPLFHVTFGSPYIGFGVPFWVACYRAVRLRGILAKGTRAVMGHRRWQRCVNAALTLRQRGVLCTITALTADLNADYDAQPSLQTAVQPVTPARSALYMPSSTPAAVFCYHA